MATVLIPALLRDLTGGQQRLEVQGATLRQVLKSLGVQFPAITERLLEDGLVRPGVSFAVNGDIVAHGLTEPIPDDAEITIVPAVSGGGLAPGAAARRA